MNFQIKREGFQEVRFSKHTHTKIRATHLQPQNGSPLETKTIQLRGLLTVLSMGMIWPKNTKSTQGVPRYAK